MAKQRWVDISVGLFVLSGILALSVMAMKVSGVSRWSSNKSYHVTAEFADIGSLKVRSPVTIAGVKIGEVTRIELQSADLNAKVTMLLRQDKPIPFQDTSARILTQGLLGSNYISIVPGFDDDSKSAHAYLRDGDMIARTQEAMILENLIGQLLFNIKK